MLDELSLKDDEFIESLKDQIRPFLISTVNQTVEQFNTNENIDPKIHRRLRKLIWEIFADIAIDNYEESSESTPNPKPTQIE